MVECNAILCAGVLGPKPVSLFREINHQFNWLNRSSGAIHLLHDVAYICLRICWRSLGMDNWMDTASQIQLQGGRVAKPWVFSLTDLHSIYSMLQLVWPRCSCVPHTSQYSISQGAVKSSRRNVWPSPSPGSTRRGGLERKRAESLSFVYKSWVGLSASLLDNPADVVHVVQLLLIEKAERLKKETEAGCVRS